MMKDAHMLKSNFRAVIAWFAGRITKKTHVSRRARALDGKQQAILLDYPVRCVPRYGYGKPPHQALYEMIAARRAAYEKTLRAFLPCVNDLAVIPVHAIDSEPDDPHWVNGFLPGLDAVAIYGFLAIRNPGLYTEIGSGNSTKFARSAIRRRRLQTRITSIDPTPRANVAAIVDDIIVRPLEDVDVRLFDELGEGDMLFFDGSHRSFMNSDVTVFFLEILPRLRPGVLVGIHDICLPLDYPPAYAPHFYSEQYLLATYLLGGASRMENLHYLPIL
jgi:hypothetical protein